MLSALRTQGRYTLVLLTAGLGITFSVVTFSLLLNFQCHQSTADLDRTAKDNALPLETSIIANVEALHEIQSFFQASGKVERDGFRAFAKHELAQHPGIQAMEWVPRVPARELAAYEEAARNDGFPEFRVVERNSLGNIAQAKFQEEYFPVFYVEPYEGNEAALGFDLASNPILLQALNKSWDTGQTVATPGNCSELRGSEQPAAFQEGIETSGPPGAKEGCQGHLAVGALP